MRALDGALLAVAVSFSSLIHQTVAQTCTISGTGTINWSNGSPPACTEGGNAGGASVIVVPAGVILNFDNNADTWTGTRIDVFGTLRISAPGQVTINSSIVVKNGGLLDILSKINIGSSAGCGYTLIVETGGTVNVGSGASDRLNICGTEIARGGGGGCNPYPAGPLPYCEPGGGFTGPTGFDENGYNPTLPVTLVYFTVNAESQAIHLSWATEKEEKFDRFVVQRAHGNFSFEDIGEVQGAGYDTYSLREYFFVDKNPRIGTAYYRLKAVDLDGSFEYFGPLSQNYNGDYAIWIVPNPSTGEFVGFETNFSPGDGDRIQIISSVGTVIGDFKAAEVKGVIAFTAPLKPGVYLMKYSSATVARVIRFVVVN